MVTAKRNTQTHKEQRGHDAACAYLEEKKQMGVLEFSAFDSGQTGTRFGRLTTHLREFFEVIWPELKRIAAHHGLQPNRVIRYYSTEETDWVEMPVQLSCEHGDIEVRVTFWLYPRSVREKGEF